MSLRDIILQSKDLGELVPVDVDVWPETKGKLFVRQMTALEYLKYEAKLREFIDGKDKDNLYSIVAIIQILVDKDGKRIFEDSDLQALSGKNAEALQAIYRAWSEARNAESAEDTKKN